MIDEILNKAPLFLLIYARSFSLLLTAPLFSTRTASRIAKVALAGYISFFLFGTTNLSVYDSYITFDGVFNFQYFLLVLGEALIGVIIGFSITIIFAAFSAAGQFLGFQMGLSAASSYDSMSQVENPLMGQFFNLVAMLVFMQTKYFQLLFLKGLSLSFESLNALSIVNTTEKIASFMIKGLVNLFCDALIIALPVMGTLLLITICTGLLTKAAPQMNLLSEGFPIMIIVAFLVINFAFPKLIDFFMGSFEKSFFDLERFFVEFKK